MVGAALVAARFGLLSPEFRQNQSWQYAAVTKAPNYIPLANQANAKTFAYPGSGIPPGPYAV